MSRNKNSVLLRKKSEWDKFIFSWEKLKTCHLPKLLSHGVASSKGQSGTKFLELLQEKYSQTKNKTPSNLILFEVISIYYISIHWHFLFSQQSLFINVIFLDNKYIKLYLNLWKSKDESNANIKPSRISSRENPTTSIQRVNWRIQQESLKRWFRTIITNW